MSHSRIAAEAKKLASEFDRIALERPGKSVVGGWHFACGESPESCRDCDHIQSTRDQAGLLLEVLYADPEANEDAVFDGWFVHELINPFAHRSTPQKQFALIRYAFNFAPVFTCLEYHRIGRPIEESASPVISLACRGNQLRQMCESVPGFLEITNLSLALTGADQEPRNKAYRFEMFEWACFVVLICERYLSLPHYGRYALTARYQ